MSFTFPQYNIPVSSKIPIEKPAYEVINVEFTSQLKLKNNISNDIIIDSRNRDTTVFKDPSSYTIYLPNTYRDVLYLRLKKCIIPKTHYSVDTNNNVIHYKELYNYHTFTNIIELPIPIGNYKKENFGKGGQLDLMNVLSTYMTDRSEFGFSYFFTYNELLERIDIEVKPQEAMVEIYFGDGKKYNENTIGEVIGFSPKIFKSNISPNNIINGDQIINLELNNQTYLQINAYQNIEGKIELTGSPTFFIPLKGIFGQNSIYLPGNLIKQDTKYFNPIENKINRIDIKFLTYNNKLFSFHGVNHVIELELYQTNFKKIIETKN